MRRYSSQIHIVGQPTASFTIHGVPSINTCFNKHFRQRSVITNEWRTWANDEASAHMWSEELVGPVVDRALVLVNVFSYYEEVMDVHNAHIKPILDGFTDAGIFRDDEWTYVPVVMFRWAGSHDKRTRKIVLDIYELDELFIGHYGGKQRLPKGRKRIGE